MPSQEDYLDGLLKDLTKSGEKQEESAAEDIMTEEVISSMSEEGTELEEVLPKEPELPGLQEASEEPEIKENPEGVEEEAALDFPEEAVMPDIADLMPEEEGTELEEVLPKEPELPELQEASEEPELPEPQEAFEEPEMPEILGAFEEEGMEPAEVSVMSEEEIEKLLAAGREMTEASDHEAAEEFQGDIADLLEGSDDSELQEIQELLEKADNNEAVGEEIESLLRGEAQEENQMPETVFDSEETADADAGDQPEEQLTPKQQKALEKKRLKEEKAAARKAAKEAKKAEKEAKKKGKKQDKNEENDEALSVSDIAVEEGEETEETVDTAFLDSILSEAGKLDGDENIVSATGNYDAKVEGNFQDQAEEEEDFSATEDMGDSPVDSTGIGDLGLDLNNLFGDSESAENAMLAGTGSSDFPDFIALDADDGASIAELTGEEEEKPKKKGFFSRFLEFLTEEDEDEEEENENIQLSDENQGIIEELDKEKNKKDKKKGKKGKKKDKKKDASAEGGEKDEEGESGNEQNKKGKKKKPKKERPPKEAEIVDPKNKLTLKKILPVILICLSLGLAIVIIANVSVDYTDKKAARDAYYDGDYQTCYQNLFGKDLNESDQVMFGKSESILYIRLWISEYEMFAAEGAQLEALDSLIQSVNDYPVLYEYAAQWNAAGKVAAEYATLLNLLYENYGLTEDQARAIAAEPDDIEYTRMVYTIVQGGAYGSWNEPEPVEEGPLPEELPEETELPSGNFIDTNPSGQ